MKWYAVRLFLTCFPDAPESAACYTLFTMLHTMPTALHSWPAMRSLKTKLFFVYALMGICMLS